MNRFVVLMHEMREVAAKDSDLQQLLDDVARLSWPESKQRDAKLNSRLRSVGSTKRPKNRKLG
jgi:hypothetical protein